MMRRISVKNRKKRDACTAKFLVESATARRYACVGDRSVLSATVIYPVLTVAPSDVDADILEMLRKRAERFNGCYRHICDAFLEWCMGEVAEIARSSYAAMGERAAYCFPRRGLLCNITTDESELSIRLVRLGSTKATRTVRGEDALLHVTLITTETVGRTYDAKRIFTRRDVWRLPDVTMEKPARQAYDDGRRMILEEGEGDGDAV